jgi:hypothetical protein
MVATFSTMDLLQERETLRPVDALQQLDIGGGPSIVLCDNDDVIGIAPDNLLSFDIVLKDSVL